MAIHLDDGVRDAAARRRAHGRTAALALRLTPVPHGGHALTVDWTAGAERASVEQRGEVPLYVDERVARYAAWHDVSISAWRLGPLRLLGVVQEPRVLSHMLAWERTHSC